MTSSLDFMRAELHAAIARTEPGIAAADELCATYAGVAGVDGAALSMVYRGESTGTFGSSSQVARRLDEHQFTFGEGPCLDAVASRSAVSAPDLQAPTEQRWPLLRGVLLDDGIRGVFAVPIMITSVCVGALDLFRTTPGPLSDDAIAGAILTAELATAPLLDVIAEAVSVDADDAALVESMQGGPGHLAEVDRVEVYQATGMVMVAIEADADEALLRLRAHAVATGQTTGEVARAIIERRLTLEKDPSSGAGGNSG